MSTPYAKLPRWVDYGLIPLVNLLVAFIVAGLVVLLVGENPFRAAGILFQGAFVVLVRHRRAAFRLRQT